jgi:nucleoside-diphosphate-sugar epimerase
MINPGQGKVLIVGGSGFLSGTLARRALARGHQVWAITRGQRSLPDGVIGLVADRQDPAAFEQAVNAAQTKWDLVIDCIAFTPEDIRQDLAVFEQLAGHLVFVSTDFVYDPQHRQFPQREETDHYVADESYGHLKRRAEEELLQYSGDLPWTIVRPCHIYGPGSKLGCLPAHGRDANLIQRIKTGDSLRLVGGGYFLQQPILARDLADFMLELQGNQKTYRQILNAAGPEVIESRRYYQIIADLLGVELTIEEIPVALYLQENPSARSFFCHRFYDLTKAQGFGLPLPSTPMAQGLREQVESLLLSGPG